MVGSGLWGPIWGFIALESDCNTIFGASFDHKSETPGLGAEIRESFFEDAFIGKKILIRIISSSQLMLSRVGPKLELPPS